MTEEEAARVAELMRRRARWLRKHSAGARTAYAGLVRTWAADLEKFADEIHQETE